MRDPPCPAFISAILRRAYITKHTLFILFLNFQLIGLNGHFRNKAYNSVRSEGLVYLALEREIKEVPSRKALGNGGTPAPAFLKHSRMGTRMK